jgi:hypothetical protein
MCKKIKPGHLSDVNLSNTERRPAGKGMCLACAAMNPKLLRRKRSG